MEIMSPEKGPETASKGGLNFEETELTLRMPGESRTAIKLGIKRSFSAAVDLNVGTSGSDGSGTTFVDGNSDVGASASAYAAAKSPASKVQVIGWPPVKSSMRNAKKSCKFVKVAVDGAPYLRKVDLESYSSYQKLLSALEDMFSCLTIRNYLNEKKLADPATGTAEYVPTYEDKDGDWMLIGDVPWKMFVETCKRLRLMKSSEAIGLGPRTPPACTASSN